MSSALACSHISCFTRRKQVICCYKDGVCYSIVFFDSLGVYLHTEHTPVRCPHTYKGFDMSYYGIGLDNIKNGINLGSAMRAAGCYGASFVAASGKRIGPASTSVSREHTKIPLFRPSNLFDLMPYDCVPVAVDLVEGAQPLQEYEHPERAFYIFGAEDHTLGNRVLSKCRDKIYIPTQGCMNLAACVNVVLYDRVAKELLK